ncbi:MAG TPA: radical SAM protein [Candidatus Ozemobacteraceae bacterium]|nr:radical SAM protein [Candidatus Ozemobacteraceae bacterium]
MQRKLLLTSVFKPFGVDDAFGRKENVFELMKNQVTRAQEAFSIRSHNRSFGLSLMALNIETPTTVLDFPTQDEFMQELRRGHYSHVGISFIVPSFEKAAHMAKLVRLHSPWSKIILGGHGVSIAETERLIEHDEICRGDGVTWLRSYFGERVGAPIEHPIMRLAFNSRLFGLPIPNAKAILIPAVGCPGRCDFCATSHFFQGATEYFPDPESLFATMCHISDTLKTHEFFVLDEIFLKNADRARALAALMRRHGRRFQLDIFSSLESLAALPLQTLIELGINFVWIGIESKDDLYAKTRGLDARRIIGDLRRHGISPLTSGILFMDHHTPDNIDAEIDHLISLQPDFIQFMELAPYPGTALYKKLEAQKRIRSEVPYQEWHGQDQIWFRHPHFTPQRSKEILDEAFEREYQALGPSLLRMAETRLLGVENGVFCPGDAFLEARYRDLETIAKRLMPLLPVCERLAPNERVRARARVLIERYQRRFGPPSLLQSALSLTAAFCARREKRHLRLNLPPLQPQTFIERFRH